MILRAYLWYWILTLKTTIGTMNAFVPQRPVSKSTSIGTMKLKKYLIDRLKLKSAKRLEFIYHREWLRLHLRYEIMLRNFDDAFLIRNEIWNILKPTQGTIVKMNVWWTLWKKNADAWNFQCQVRNARLRLFFWALPELHGIFGTPRSEISCNSKSARKIPWSTSDLHDDIHTQSIRFNFS